MRSGRLRHKVEVLENQPVPNTTHGGKIDNWVVVHTRRADFKFQSGRQYLDAQQVNHEIRAMVRMRYLADLSEKHRIRFNSTDYEIIADPNPERRRRDLEVMLKAVK